MFEEEHCVSVIRKSQTRSDGLQTLHDTLGSSSLLSTVHVLAASFWNTWAQALSALLFFFFSFYFIFICIRKQKENNAVEQLKCLDKQTRLTVLDTLENFLLKLENTPANISSNLLSIFLYFA